MTTPALLISRAGSRVGLVSKSTEHRSRRHVMKTSRVLAIVSLFALLTPAMAQIRIVKVNVPFDFVVGTQTMPAGEYSFAVNGVGALRISQTNGPAIAGIVAAPIAGNDNDTPRLLFHRYGNRAFLTEVWAGEMSLSHRLYASPAELEYAKGTKQETTTILAQK